jgi:hypothetical protein
VNIYATIAGQPGRFHVKHVPVPAGGFIVEDRFALPIKRLIATEGGCTFHTRHQPHSHYYETRAEAQAVADWLKERAAGYPWNPLMSEAP